MKNLSVQKLRKIILEEIKSMLNDDVLFSLDQLPASGTGKINYDHDDMMYPYDEEESEDHDGCSKCGGHHAPSSPCGEHPSNNDNIDGIVNHIIDLLS